MGIGGQERTGVNIPDPTCCLHVLPMLHRNTSPTSECAVWGRLPLVELHVCKMGGSSLVGIRLRTDGVQNITWGTEALGGEALIVIVFLPFPLFESKRQGSWSWG